MSAISPSISVAPSSISVLVGQPATIVCTGTNMNTGDITWQTESSTIYINSNYLSKNGLQYVIVNSRDANTQITTSTLTVLSVSSASTLTYTCSCNIYSSVTGCTLNTTGSATVSGYTTTTINTSTATPSTSMSKFNSLSNFSQLKKISKKKRFSN
jgi:hypothetical protein